MLQVGGNTEMIATHLREVHYQLAIICDLCKSFTSMSAQSFLEHHSGCKAKCTKECTEQEGCKLKVTQEEVKDTRAGKTPKVSLSDIDESYRVKRCLTPSIQFC